MFRAGRTTPSILAVPIDSPPDAGPGADGSINVALALDLLDHVRGTTPPLSLVVLFLGAEYGDTDAYPMGSTLFLRDFQPDYRAVVLYLNLRGVPGRVLVRSGGRGIVSPFWLMSRGMDSLSAAHVPYRLQADAVQAFRLGTTEERTLIEPYLKAGYPSIGLEGDITGPAARESPEMLGLPLGIPPGVRGRGPRRNPRGVGPSLPPGAGRRPLPDRRREDLRRRARGGAVRPASLCPCLRPAAEKVRADPSCEMPGPSFRWRHSRSFSSPRGPGPCGASLPFARSPGCGGTLRWSSSP